MVSFLCLVESLLIDFSTSSAYGLPSQADFDRLLGSNFKFLAAYHIPHDLLDQLRIAQFHATIGKALYGNASDPSGLPLDDERATTYNNMKAYPTFNTFC